MIAPGLFHSTDASMNAIPWTSKDWQELEFRRKLDRQIARESFLHYYMRMTGFMPEKHHRLICKLLQRQEDDFTDSKGRRLDNTMIFMPPRMAKSTLCTQLFPSWIIGRHPKTQIMSGVHTQKYANKTGKLVRNHLRNRAYPFETELSPDSQAKDQWATTAGGEYNGFGLMGGSTHGNPAEWLITDDLIKGRKMALSEHMREEAWETYKLDLLTRLQGRAKQIMVTTRWSEDDVAGRILPEGFDGSSGWYQDRETGEWWYVLSLPAKAEHERDPLGRKPGEYLVDFETKKGDRFWEKFEQRWKSAERRGGYMWSALHQQRPAPEEGLLFQAEHIQYFNLGDLNLDEITVYITSDYAVTAEAGSPDPDYTVHTVWGIDHEWNIYMLDMWRGRTLSDEWVKQWIRLCKLWKPLIAGEEQGQIIKGVGPFLTQQMRDEQVFVHRKQYPSVTSKEARAQPLLGMASMGKLWLQRGHPMTDLFRAELLTFPAGRHDDMVDTATLMARMLGDILAGTERKKTSPQGETLIELFLRHEKEDG